MKKKVADPISIVFLCTGNSCRSQMAEGFATALHGDLFKAGSAGIEQHGMNPRTMKVMQEAGVDISEQYSKTIAELDDRDFDIVVTVCDHAQEVCPVLPANVRVIHHSFKDPANSNHLPDEDAILSVYREVRDEIQAWISDLPVALESELEYLALGSE